MRRLSLLSGTLLFASVLQGCDCGGVALPADGGPNDQDAASGDSGTDGGDGGLTDAGETDGGTDAGTDAGEPDGGPDGGCPTLSCTGWCGPVRDFCTGQVLECGACQAGLVCNLLTHACVTPAVDCAALGADCGQIRNSCGFRLNCGACSDPTMECDRNTHKCVACSHPTCQDLGYECGDVWLGCGPFSNTTHCGDCSAGTVCNPGLNICESQCTPAQDSVVCQAAGAECGTVTNGCGGFANCGGCPSGKTCGAQGIGNKCDLPEIPDECLVANRTCGTLSSACGGVTLNCGSCTPPDVCSPSGTCEAPCTPSTCSDPALAGQCGTGLDAGCQRSVSCPCSSGLFCTASDAGIAGTCTPSAGCAVFNANGLAGDVCSTAPNPAFPKGDGTNLTCNCAGGRACSVAGTPPHLAGPGEEGTCCTNTAVCGNQCNVTLHDTCTNATITCTCGAGNNCNTSTNLCQPNLTCGTYGANGAVGDACSNGNDPTDFPRFTGDPTGLTCRCSGTENCYNGSGGVVSGAAKGTCCQPDVCPTNTCTPIVDHCSGSSISCSCSGGNHCNGSLVCVPDLTCSTYGANGASTNPCSNGPDPAFPKGDGTDLTCRCNSGGLCMSGGVVVSGPTTGTCCFNTAVCPANTCGSVVNTCTGATINCSCSAGNHCSSSTCVPDKTCADYNATGQIGKACSTGPDSAFPGGPGGANLTCPCSTSAPNQNNTCAGSTSSVAGTCTCTPSTPANCSDNGRSDGCGGTMSSPCGSGQVCYQSACCTSPVCPAGNAGDACGPRSACGVSLNCPCTQMYQTCGAVSAGVCGCNPKTLADCGVTLPPGQTSPNGCGGFVTCPG